MIGFAICGIYLMILAIMQMIEHDNPVNVDQPRRTYSDFEAGYCSTPKDEPAYPYHPGPPCCP